MSGSFHNVNSFDHYNENESSTQSNEAYPAPNISTEPPLPNPPFVFPARSSPSAASGFSRANGRRPKSAHALSGAGAMNMDFKMGGARSGPPPLPSFSFNQTPATQDPADNAAPLSPGAQLLQSMQMPSRPASHTRGASELVSSDRKTGHMSLLSISAPQEHGTAPATGPSKGKRGHAHRRSAAISCGDLSFLVKPPDVAPPVPALPAFSFGGSASTTSADESKAFGPASADNTAQATLDKTSTTESEQPATTTPPRKAGRVGFSDTVEFIPRPLSLISSDTSSTMTIRNGHSLSSSICSVVSFSSPSSPAQEFRSFPMAPRSIETDHARPSTAGPVLSYTRSHESLRADDDEAAMRRSSDPPKADKSMVAKAVFASRGSKGYNFCADSPAYSSSPSSSRTVSATSVPRLSDYNTSSSGFSNPLPDGYSDMPRLARKTSSTRNSIKKKKKVKSWAGSILSRKARPRSKTPKVSKRSATPPMKSYAVELNRVNARLAEVDHTPDIDLDDAYAPLSPHDIDAAGSSNFANWKPRHIPTHDDDDSSSTVIDLDAALGPFNTPTHDKEWREAQGQTAARRKKNMHSQAGMKNFNGPGLHYHRRAESAPASAFVPFENPRFTASGSVMEDVFEEEEEDDWEEVKGVSHKGSTIKNDEEEAIGLGIEIKVVDAEDGHDTMDWTNDKENDSLRRLKMKTSALSDMESVNATSAATFASSSSPLKESFNMDDFAPPPRFGDDCSIQRPQSSSRSSTSSITPPVRSNYGKEYPILENQTYVGQPPWLTPTTPNSNTFQSPFPSPRSPMSQDTQRQSTAPSSILEEPGFNPLWLGEPGPEIRMSVDDVPSLTSSNSTMTRESMANTMNPAYGNPQFRNGQRSASMSGPAAQAVQQRKRGSIASLSRLLSSHGSEKSKLSIEDRAPGAEETTRKDSRKRISRLMQFWKPKNREPTPPKET